MKGEKYASFLRANNEADFFEEAFSKHSFWCFLVGFWVFSQNMPDYGLGLIHFCTLLFGRVCVALQYILMHCTALLIFYIEYIFTILKMEKRKRIYGTVER